MDKIILNDILHKYLSNFHRQRTVARFTLAVLSNRTLKEALLARKKYIATYHAEPKGATL